MPYFQTFKSRDHDLDLRSGHMAYRCAALIELYLHTKFHSNRRNFLWTNITLCDQWTLKLHDTKTMPNFNNPAWSNLDIVLYFKQSTVICQLALKMGEKIHFKNGWFSNFQILMTLTWPWIRSYGILSCSTHRCLPTYQISCKSELFVDVCMHVRMHVRSDGHRESGVTGSTL